ncbi:MAG TPA: TonB-dependent receptor [Bacteroidia bacterium]|nr:TonB-dependent receptor [Bacteroidia bacterium]
MPHIYYNQVVTRFCFCIIAMIIGQNVVSQTTIKGKVTDSTKTAVPYAALGLMNAKDTSFIRSVLANDSGSYVFVNIKTGNYLLKTIVTGYVTQFSALIKVDSTKTTLLQNIELKNAGNNLKGVSIKADKPFVVRKEDRTIYNVENSILATGKTALEVLNDLPGITADDNGNISVLAKGGALILVDDKPLRMDLASFLKSIDGSQIESIEVITNPSAKYQAQGKAVINIILKKDKNMGLNGMLTSTYRQGYYAAGATNLNIDYRVKNWNFFFLTNVNDFHNHETHEVTTSFLSGNTTQEIFNENIPANYQGTVSFANTGFDFTPDNKQTFSFSVRGDAQLEKNIHTYDNTIMHTPATEVDSSLASTNSRQYNAWNLEYDLNYKYKIDSTGKELAIDIDYTQHGSTDNQQSPAYYYNANGDFLRPSTLTSSSQLNNMPLLLNQLDYTQPLSKNNKLDMGVLVTLFQSSNNAAFYNSINGVNIADTTKSNQFNFSENVFAGYLNYSQKLSEKINFLAGLRAEQTQDKGMQYIHDTSFTRNYINLFPSASLNWNLSKDHTFSISYTRRIDRPDYGSLNPFITVMNPYTYSEGNIALLPQISDNYEFDYTFMQFLTTTIWHVYLTNVISNAYQQNGSTDVIYTMPVNIGTYSTYGIMLSASLPITKWWNTTTSFMYYNDFYTGSYNNSSYAKSNNSFVIRTENMINLKKGWKAEIAFNYTSSNLNVFNYTYPVSYTEAGLSKSFIDDKLTLKINCSDIFMGLKTTNLQVSPGLNILDVDYQDQRKFRFIVSWKFGRSEYQREQAQKQNALLRVGPK